MQTHSLVKRTIMGLLASVALAGPIATANAQAPAPAPSVLHGSDCRAA